MIEITSTELRKNIGKYLDIAMQKKEQVLVRHRNKGVFMLTPKQTNGHRPKRTDTSDNPVENQELQQIIKEAEEDFDAGRHTVIKNPANIWDSIQ